MAEPEERAEQKYPFWLPTGDYETDREDYDEEDAKWQNAEAEMQRQAYIAGAESERAKLQDRIEVLEKNLAYEVAQKIKLAEQLQAATVTGPTLEQARWKLHAGIESRCSEEVAAEAKPVIDLVFSSLALEPEAREIPDAEVAAAYSAFVQASFGSPGAPAMRAALEASRDA